MCNIPMRLAHYCLAALTTAVAFGCDDVTDPGSIMLAVTSPSATVHQGASVDVATTLTRFGSFTGTVSITVTGTPPGVTAAVSNVQTSGAVTTTTVTITAAASTVPGTYTIAVRGNGAGVSEAVADLALTVTEAPAYTLTPVAPALIIVQGTSASIAVNIVRTNFTGAVTLTLEQPQRPALPGGIRASFSNNPATGLASLLQIVVDETVAAGTYSLVIRGVAPGLSDRSVAFTLTVTEPPGAFTLTLSDPAFTIVKDANIRAITVHIGRTNFTGGVMLSLQQPEEALPAGIIATFDSNPATGASSVLTITVGSTVAAGTYSLVLHGVAPGVAFRSATLTLTVAEAGSPSYTLSASPAMLTLIEGGGAQTSTISISRTGGFTGSVALSVTSPVPGIGGGETTATLDPASTTGNSSTLSADTHAGPGTYTLAITGKTTGLPDQIITILVTVLP